MLQNIILQKIKLCHIMIDDGVMKGTYVETTDNTLKELPRFQDFLHRKFHNHECYKDMKLIEINQYVFMEQLKPTKLKP